MKQIAEIVKQLAGIEELLVAAYEDYEALESTAKKNKDMDKAYEYLDKQAVIVEVKDELDKMMAKLSLHFSPQTDSITPLHEYYLPILKALEKLGGKAATNEVINKVGEIMSNKLTTKDREPLESNANIIRWRNHTQWARNTLVHSMGWLKKGSPSGIWEISETGIQQLKTKKK